MTDRPAHQHETSPGATNVEIVTYALAELDGAQHPVHLEEIAEKCFALVPGAFRWDLDRYASFIDKDKVRVSLTDARKEKLGGLVRAVGSTRAGISKTTDAWQLTTEGAAWYLKERNRLAALLGVSRPSLKKGRATDLRNRIVRSDLYDEYRRTGKVSGNPYTFADLLECSPDAKNSVVRDKLEALMTQTRLLDDEDLLQFLARCAEANSEMLGD